MWGLCCVVQTAYIGHAPLYRQPVHRILLNENQYEHLCRFAVHKYVLGVAVSQAY